MIHFTCINHHFKQIKCINEYWIHHTDKTVELIIEAHILHEFYVTKDTFTLFKTITIFLDKSYTSTTAKFTSNTKSIGCLKRFLWYAYDFVKQLSMIRSYVKYLALDRSWTRITLWNWILVCFWVKIPLKYWKLIYPYKGFSQSYTASTVSDLKYVLIIIILASLTQHINLLTF